MPKTLLLPCLLKEEEEVPKIKVKNPSELLIDKKSLPNSHLENTWVALVVKSETGIRKVIVSDLPDRRPRYHVHENPMCDVW